MFGMECTECEPRCVHGRFWTWWLIEVESRTSRGGFVIFRDFEFRRRKHASDWEYWRQWGSFSQVNGSTFSEGFEEPHSCRWGRRFERWHWLQSRSVGLKWRRRDSWWQLWCSFSSGVCSLHVIHFSQVTNEERGRSGGKLIVLSLYGSNETNDESGGRSKWRSEGQRRKSLGIWEESVRPGMGEFWKTSAANVGEKRSSSRRNAGCTSQVTSHTCRWNTSKEGAEMSQGNASLEFQLDNSCNETKQFEQPVEKYHGIFRRWAGCRFGGERTLLVLRVTLTNFSWPS